MKKAFLLTVLTVTIMALSACSKHEHTEGDWIVDAEASCSLTGIKHIACVECGETLKTAQIEKLNHESGDWITDVEASCSQAGKRHKECIHCGENMETELIEILAHEAGEWIIDKEGSCSEVGSRHQECTVCHETIAVEEIIVEHAYGDFELVEEWTCEKSGSVKHTCNACGFVEIVEIIAEGHQLVETVILPASCNTEGLLERKCSNCDFKESEVLAAEHSFGKWTVILQATCTVEGISTHRCTVCGFDETVTGKLDHEYTDIDVITAVTCTTPGFIKKTCSLCKQTVEEEVAATGHAFSDWNIIRALSCTEDGERERICSVCSEKEHEVQVAGGHNYSGWITTKTPTVAEAGSRESVCSTCGIKVTEALPRVTAEKVGNTTGNRNYVFDGGYIYYVDFSQYNTAIPTSRGMGGYVYRCNADGSGATLLISKVINGIAIMDGILYAREMCSEDGYWQNNYTKIWTYNLSNGALNKLEMYYPTSGGTELIDYALHDMLVTSNYIYVSSNDSYNHLYNGKKQETGIFRMNFDGTGVTKISDHNTSGMFFAGDYIVNCARVDYKMAICMFDLDGNRIYAHPYNSTNYDMVYTNGKLYFKNMYSGPKDHYKICSMNLDGSDYREICECQTEFVVMGDWIYGADMKTYEVFRIRTDGTDRTVIFTSKDLLVADSIVYNGFVYFLNREKVYAVKYDANGNWSYVQVSANGILAPIEGGMPYPN